MYTYEDCDAIYGGGLINEAGHICVGTPGEVSACFVSLFPFFNYQTVLISLTFVSVDLSF